MIESLHINSTDKKEQYQELLSQLVHLVSHESDLIANMANITAALKTVFNWLWVGFYLVKDKELVLGPFQGPMACTRISYAKGVCGKVWQLNECLIVPDVNQFDGHIACSSLSKSEIVLPINNSKSEVVGVLDIDSSELDAFDQTDRQYLTKIIQLLKF